MNKKEPRGLVGGVFQDAFILPRVENGSQVESLSKTSRFDTVYSELNKLNYSKQYKLLSHSEIARLFSNLHDVIPDDGYTGFYVNRLKDVGKERFIELANKARAGSDTPAKLFAWMLKNNEVVK